MNNVLNNFRSFFLMTKRHKISELLIVAHFNNLKVISNTYCKVTIKRSPVQDGIACWTTMVLDILSGNHLKCTSLKNKIIYIWKYFPRYWPFMREIHRSQRPVTRGCDVFFVLLLNKWLSKNSRGWWFETPLCPSWRHCNDFFVRFKLIRCSWVLL